MSAKALTVLAAVLIGVGALVGFIPVTSQGTSCGSAFVQSGDASVSDMAEALSGRSSDTRSTCTDLRSLVRIPALILLIGGGVVLVAAGVVNGRRRPTAMSD